MKNSYSDVAFVWEVHHLTNKVRVGVSNQQGVKDNFVVICCTPSMNGLYKWDARNKSNYSMITNNRKTCYCVPIEDLKFINKLEDMPESLKKIAKSMQEDWFKFYKKKNEPDWFLKG